MRPPFDSLKNQLSEGADLYTDLTDFQDYLTDATPNVGSASAVLLAHTETDIVKAVFFCKEHNLPLVARGAGTGLSGGCVPLANSLVLSVERMTSLLISPDKRLAICGPGVITKTIMDSAAEFGLTYLPDPASYEESTIAGNVAENAGGLRCKRYGVTRDYILGLRAVTSDVNILTTGQYSKSGFNLNDCLIGSEGTLAIITEIVVELAPIPTPGDTILVAFDHPADAAQSVADIVSSGIIPTVLEFLDGDAAAVSNEYESGGWTADVAGILLIETSGDSPTDTQTVIDICKNNRFSLLEVESDPEKAAQLWKIRRNLSNATKAIAKVRVNEDVAVPVSKFPQLVTFVSEMNKKSKMRINSFGHAGDGNLHVNFLSATGSTQDIQEIERLTESLMKKTIELGGTLSGEHGIGLEKRRFLEIEFSPATLQTMRHLKSEFDPDSLFNPGKIFKKTAKK